MCEIRAAGQIRSAIAIAFLTRIKLLRAPCASPRNDMDLGEPLSDEGGCMGSRMDRPDDRYLRDDTGGASAYFV